MIANWTTAWKLSASVASVQLLVAAIALNASNKDVLSLTACLGGVFGSLINLAILLVVAIGILVLGAKSIQAKAWHSRFAPLCLLLLSSAVSLWIGQFAAFRCTV